MRVLSLCQQFCPNSLPVQPATCLGDGANGECFAIVGDPHKVIKLAVLYEREEGMLDDYQRIQSSLNYLIHTHPHAYAHVYSQGYLGSYSRPMQFWLAGERKFVLYYYIMERLRKITEDERKVFHSILSHEDRGISKDYSATKLREMLQGMRRGLDFDMEKVMLFLAQIKQTPISHEDLHRRNIMKDSAGDFRLIDFDSITLTTVENLK